MDFYFVGKFTCRQAFTSTFIISIQVECAHGNKCIEIFIETITEVNDNNRIYQRIYRFGKYNTKRKLKENWIEWITTIYSIVYNSILFADVSCSVETCVSSSYIRKTFFCWFSTLISYGAWCVVRVRIRINKDKVNLY